MKALNCDMCKTSLDDGVSGRTYFHICTFDICEDCRDKVEAKMRPIIRAAAPYSQAWYADQYLKLIQSGVKSRR